MIAEKLYDCEYRTASPDGTEERTFPSHLWATPNSLAEIINARGLGECATGCLLLNPDHPPLWQVIEKNGVTIDILHYACFVGFLALKSGSSSIDTILGDKGLLHEMIHCLCFPDAPETTTRETLVEMACTIEQAIPGHLPMSRHQCRNQQHDF